MKETKEISPSVSRSVDELELMLKELPQVDCPLDHTFTPGLYTRSIFMPANSVIVSKIHKTRHPFIISKGSVHVRVNEKEWTLLTAPYLGITEPNTRRVLVVVEDCIWSTAHVLVEGEGPVGDGKAEILNAVDKIEERIIEEHDINSHLIYNQ